MSTPKRNTWRELPPAGNDAPYRLWRMNLPVVGSLDFDQIEMDGEVNPDEANLNEIRGGKATCLIEVRRYMARMSEETRWPNRSDLVYAMRGYAHKSVMCDLAEGRNIGACFVLFRETPRFDIQQHLRVLLRPKYEWDEHLWRGDLEMVWVHDMFTDGGWQIGTGNSYAQWIRSGCRDPFRGWNINEYIEWGQANGKVERPK